MDRERSHKEWEDEDGEEHHKAKFSISHILGVFDQF